MHIHSLTFGSDFQFPQSSFQMKTKLGLKQKNLGIFRHILTSSSLSLALNLIPLDFFYVILCLAAWVYDEQDKVIVQKIVCSLYISVTS